MMIPLPCFAFSLINIFLNAAKQEQYLSALIQQKEINLLESILKFLSDFVSGHYGLIAMMIISTLLVLYGNEINKQIKKMVGHYHFLIRTCVFILVCAFGYGFLTTWLIPHLIQLIKHIPYLYQGIAVVIMLVLLGVLAERKNNI